jgi:alcohol dehydrogenase class IV
MLKAYVRFTGSTGAIISSYNVSGVTRNATGDYTITFASALADALYVVTGSLSYPQWGIGPSDSNSVDHGAASMTTTTCRVVISRGGGGTVDSAVVMVAIFR